MQGQQEPGWQDTDEDAFLEGVYGSDNGSDFEPGDLIDVEDDEDEGELLAGGTADQLHLPQALQQQQGQQLLPHTQPEQQQMDQADEEEGQALLQALQQAHPRDLHRFLRRLHRQVLPLADPAQADAAAGEEAAGSSASGDDSSSSGDGSMSDDEAESGGSDESKPAAGCTHFDPNTAARHGYLGDVDDLGGCDGHLPEGTVTRLPLLVLDGVVLFPGFELPLLLNTPQELHLLDRALAAPAPFTRLLAVLPGPRSLLRALPRLVCCTAEVRQMRRQSDDEQQGSVAVLALGRQRAEVVQDGRNCAQSQVSVNVRILPEGCTSDVPLLMRQGFSSIHPALTRPWDLALLVGRVRHLMELVLLPAASFQGTPLELSYWVSHNLPLQPSTRQLLLMCSCPAERLRLLLELLQRLDRLCCSACGRQLATTAEVLAMTTEGIGGTYVNSHGYVHEMVTFSKVHGLRLYGGPETAHSWFDGYAWTIAHCGTCGQHLGWRFTATRPGLMPRSFWGIRRPGLLCATAPAGSSDGSEQEEPQGRVGPGGGQRQAAAGPQVQEQNWMDLLLRGVRRGRLVLHLRQQPGEADDAGG